MSTMDLHGRIALVTGASRGIGARVAVTLARAGAAVAVHYGLAREKAEAVATEIRAAGGPEPFVVGGDLGDTESRRRIYALVAEELGSPGILVHNAAIYGRNPWDGDDGDFLARWRRTLEVNLEAAAHLTFLALPAMRRNGFGRIVMVSSRAAFRGETECADYAVSKAGMVNLARCLARSEGRYGITANSVCPGWVATEMAEPELTVRGDEIRAEIPLGRVATPDDVANAVLFLASPLGEYANGTAIGLNGGSFLH